MKQQYFNFLNFNWKGAIIISKMEGKMFQMLKAISKAYRFWEPILLLSQMAGYYNFKSAC